MQRGSWVFLLSQPLVMERRVWFTRILGPSSGYCPLRCGFQCIEHIMDVNTESWLKLKMQEPELPQANSSPDEASAGHSSSLPDGDHGNVGEKRPMSSCSASSLAVSLSAQPQQSVNSSDKWCLSNLCWVFPGWQDRVKDITCACSYDCHSTAGSNILSFIFFFFRWRN